MLERQQDKEDVMLKALLGGEEIADGDFSKRVLWRIRRRLWVQRAVLPVAALMGGLVAVRPATELLTSLLATASPLARDLAHASLPPYLLTTLAPVVLGTAVFVLAIRLLDD